MDHNDHLSRTQIWKLIIMIQRSFSHRIYENIGAIQGFPCGSAGKENIGAI